MEKRIDFDEKKIIDIQKNVHNYIMDLTRMSNKDRDYNTENMLRYSLGGLIDVEKVLENLLHSIGLKGTLSKEI